MSDEPNKRLNEWRKKLGKPELKTPGHHNEGPDWQKTVRIGAHLITLNLVAAILIAGFFLIVQKTEPTALPGSEVHQVLEKAAADQ